MLIHLSRVDKNGNRRDTYIDYVCGGTVPRYKRNLQCPCQRTACSGKAIGIGYDPSSSGFGRISVGVVSEDGVYHQHLGVTDRFGNDPDKVFAQQVAQLGPNMMDLIKFFVRGQEKDFKPKSAGLSRK